MRRLIVAGVLGSVLSSLAFAQQTAPKAKPAKKPTAAVAATVAPVANPVGSAAAADPQASVPHPAPVTAVEPILSAEPVAQANFPGGKFALQGMYPNGGSQVGTPAAGLRMVLRPDLALSGWLQLGYDKAAKTHSVGISGKVQKFLKTNSRAMPYGFGLVSLGKNGGDNVKDDAAELQGSAAGGLGVEVFLIPEISTFVEAGLGVKLLPADSLTLGTASAAFGLSYNFDF